MKQEFDKSRKIKDVISYLVFGVGILNILYFILLKVNAKPHPFHFLREIHGFETIFIWISILLFILFIFIRKNVFHKIEKKFKIFGLAIISIAMIVTVINLSFICNPETDNNCSPKYVILLGGGTYETGELSEVSEERMKLCSEFLKKNPDTLCIPTGYSGKYGFSFSEADIMKRELVKRGIEEKRIIIEPYAHDTIQNIQYSLKMISEAEDISMDEASKIPITIITSDTHLRRAERLAKRIGLNNVHGVSAKTPLLYMPVSLFRENLSYIKLNLRILLTGKPNKEWINS